MILNLLSKSVIFIKDVLTALFLDKVVIGLYISLLIISLLCVLYYIIIKKKGIKFILDVNNVYKLIRNIKTKLVYLIFIVFVINLWLVYTSMSY